MRRRSFGVKYIGIGGLVLMGMLLFVFGWRKLDSVPPMEHVPFLVELSSEEQVWLKDHPVIRVASDAAWAPIEWKNEGGVFSGLAIDYLRVVEAQLNVSFEIVDSSSWKALMRGGQEQEIDLFSSITPTTERMRYLLFTRPYISVPIRLYIREETADINGLQGLDGTRVAVVGEYAIEEFLRTDYPQIQLVPVETVQAGLFLLQRGEVYALAGNQLTVEYSIEQLDLNSIKVGGDTPYSNHLGMGVRKDWPILVSILHKSLDAIPYSAHRKIHQRWDLTEAGYWTERIPGWVWGLIFGAVGVGLLLIGVNWVLKHQIKIKTAELGDGKERYRMLVECQTDLVVKVDVAGRFLYASPTYCRLFDKTEKELLGQVFMPLVHKDDLVVMEEAVATLLHPPHKAYVEQRMMTRGGWRWLAWQDSGILDENGNLKEVIQVGRDITDRKEALEAYHKSNERLQLALKSSQLGIWEYDPVHDRFTGDGEVFAQYGVREDDFEGSIEAWQRCIHPDDRIMSEQVFRDALESGAPFEMEFRVVWPDQSIHYLRVLGSVELDVEGRAVRAMGTNRDVTHSKNMMAALRESEEGDTGSCARI